MNGAATSCIIRRDRYLDSVLLMQVSKRLAAEPGISDAVVVMATDANRARTVAAGYPRSEIERAGPDDLLACVRAGSPEDAAAALARLEILLDERAPDRSRARSLEDALVAQPRTNVAAISVPGEFADEEAAKALERGLNVFLFSSNVPLEKEIALKRAARDKGLIVMGPDCGTSIIGGIGLGFANGVRRGPIGVVGAAGTGIQALTTLVHSLGSGISHAIGVGSRDLSDEVGAISTLTALDALDADESTEVVVLIAKSTGTTARAAVERRIHTMRKPVHEYLLTPGGKTLEEAAVEVVGRLQGTFDASPGYFEQAEDHKRSPGHGRSYVRGLFAGGTLCTEAQMIFLDAGVKARSNTPLLAELALKDGDPAHTLIDMGSEEYTLGRPHPMIDARARSERLVHEARDPLTAVLLIDVVLGHGASADPAGDLVHALRSVEEESGGEIPIVASVCGTELDPQGLERQVKTLTDAGVIVMPTSARAAKMALSLSGAAT